MVSNQVERLKKFKNDVTRFMSDVAEAVLAERNDPGRKVASVK